MACGKAWKDTIGNITDGCFTVPSGKGERSILSQIGSPETGLLEQSMLLFRGSKSSKSSDYQSEMNWDVFIHWCETVVFRNIAATKQKSVVVLDGAAYHTVLDDEYRRSVQSLSKSRLISSIERWGGPPDN